ncbi:hypothetical protein ACFTAO_46940 [Paenibacillus rhizoplanae]
MQDYTHCMTRLRFNLRENGAADRIKLKELPGVMDVNINGGQFQVIIGNDVSKVYGELSKIAKKTMLALPRRTLNNKVTIKGRSSALRLRLASFCRYLTGNIQSHCSGYSGSRDDQGAAGCNCHVQCHSSKYGSLQKF